MAKQTTPLRDRVIGMERLRARDLRGHDGNWRTHPQFQQDALAGVLREIGIAGALLVYKSSSADGAYTIIDGHLRKAFDLEQTWPCLVLDVDDAEAQYILATHDPLTALAEADTDALRYLLANVQSGEAGVQAMLAQLAESVGVIPELPSPGLDDVAPEVDRAEALRQQYGVEAGQLWACGRHRIMCGDCTEPPVVERLLGSSQPLLMVTDPPYGVNYDPQWRNEAAERGGLSFAKRRIGKVRNDDRVDWSDAYRLFPGDVAYTWSPGGDYVILTGMALQSAGYRIRNQLIWRKPHFPISRGHYTYQHEPCWYAVRHGATAHWIGDVSASTVWEIPLDKNCEGGHSTQKPLECMARPIRNHDASEVYDPFLGSGTTLIACERLWRTCYACEIDPGYVAVALQRWAAVTGEIPVLLP
jgi:DNA modification methylase